MGDAGSPVGHGSKPSGEIALRGRRQPMPVHVIEDVRRLPAPIGDGPAVAVPSNDAPDDRALTDGRPARLTGGERAIRPPGAAPVGRTPL